MYGYLTYLTEYIANSKWEDLMKTEIFDNIGMTSSTFFNADLDTAKVDLAQGYMDNYGEPYEVPVEFQKYVLNCT